MGTYNREERVGLEEVILSSLNTKQEWLAISKIFLSESIQVSIIEDSYKSDEKIECNAKYCRSLIAIQVYETKSPPQ